MNILPLFILFTDLWGPSPTLSLNGYRYYIHFIDGRSKVTTILVAQSHRLQTFYNCKAQAELQLDCKVKNTQSTWGGEYRTFTDFLKNNGIHHQISCPWTH